ncbi:MAG: hypothetical protein ACKPEA_00215, partial [Planctomycetota bacterium]
MPPVPSIKPDPSNDKFVQAEMKGRRFGRALTKLGKVTREQVHAALALQQGEKKGKRLGEILVDMGLIQPLDIQVTLANIMGMPFVSIKDRSIDEATLKSITGETARSYQLVPVEFDASTKRM